MAKTKKAARKKATPKRLTRKQYAALKKVLAEDYTLLWDPAKDQCHFGHRSGVGGPVGCGLSDEVHVFCSGKKCYVLSLNYMAPYACLESFVDAKGVQSLVFAEPEDVRKIFKDDLSGTEPQKIAQQLATMLE